MELQDLRDAQTTLGGVREEIFDSAFSGNLQRKHHLEAALFAWEQVGLILKVEGILDDYIETLTL